MASPLSDRDLGDPDGLPLVVFRVAAKLVTGGYCGVLLPRRDVEEDYD